MTISETYLPLIETFNLGPDPVAIPGMGIDILKFPFQSRYDFPVPIHPPSKISGWSDHSFSDPFIKENSSFTYPVFVPSGLSRFGEAIIMLHGLNERNWDKYLPWARSLADQTKKPVILFPISFHINRSPQEWFDPRKLNEYLLVRQKQFRNIHASSFLNFAISNRLTEYPERFFLSGYQSVNDLTRLISSIQSGQHPLFDKGTKTNLFAYSIGVFLIQCMMIANPDNLLDDSRFFFLAGGSLFCHMNGISKYIMDSKAHETIQNYYVFRMEDEIREETGATSILNLTQIGKAFRSMILPDRFRQIRENMMKFFSKNLRVIALKNDRIIPAMESGHAIGPGKDKIPDNMTIIDPPYPYIHENPFPVKLKEYKKTIDSIFDMVFGQAAAFLG
jgi:hypothetical protein